MGKAANSVRSETVTVSLSEQSVELLDELASRGIYGRNRAEVAGRFVDKTLEQFVAAPKLKARNGPRRSRR